MYYFILLIPFKTFLMDESEKADKIHWINWDKVCYDREFRGLGIRRIRKFNMVRVSFKCEKCIQVIRYYNNFTNLLVGTDIHEYGYNFIFVCINLWVVEVHIYFIMTSIKLFMLVANFICRSQVGISLSFLFFFFVMSFLILFFYKMSFLILIVSIYYQFSFIKQNKIK